MCFSAPASFATSAALTAIGAASLNESKTKKQKVISIIPFAFAIQQAIEGYQWLALVSTGACMPAAYSYFFFAFLFWPFCIPAVLLLHEKRPRDIIKLFLTIGIAVDIYYLYAIANYPLGVSLMEHSIRYSIEIPGVPYILPMAAYLIAVCGSLFASREREVRIFGVLVFLAAAASWYFYTATFASTWCFFSAILSTTIYLHIRSTNKNRTS